VALVVPCVILVLSGALCASSVLPFQAGERWCAVGDSITHTGRYHDYVYLFYATRLPDRPIELINCGISGDTAAGVSRRLDEDVLRHCPTVATLMLGMNDVRRDLYRAESSADLTVRREAALDAYGENMREVARRLQVAGVRLVFITPSIFDQTAASSVPPLTGVDDALGRCAVQVVELARTCGGAVVDLHAPMGALNRARQAVDPAFSLVGADRIHPAEPGHFVMAYLFLKAQDLPPFAADMVLDAAGKTEVDVVLCEDALPFPVPAACRPALDWVPFMDELNQERLRIDNLPAGRYTLRIDDTTVGSFDAAAWASGINLATLTNTPQYVQALAVAALDEERFALAKQLRTIEYVEWQMLGRATNGPAWSGYHAAARKRLAAQRSPGWIRDRIAEYIAIKPRQHELSVRLKDRVDALRAAARPLPHRFIVRPEQE